VNIAPTRLAIFLLGDRLVGAAVRGPHVETFAVEGENPAEALRAQLQQHRVSPRSVALGLPRASCTVKPIELPAIGGQTRDMVMFELDRHLPSAAEDTAFDFLTLPADRRAAAGARTDAGPSRTVLIAAADRRLIDRALKIAEDVRLRPVSITIAAHDLLPLAQPPTRGRLVWVHRTAETTDLLLVADGTLALSRSVAGAGAGAIVAEIRRSFTVTRWAGCDAVWLSGDRTEDEAQALAELAPVAVPRWTPRARRLMEQIGDTPRGALELAVAVAAGPGARTLDLLPAPLRPRRLTRAQLATAAMLVVTVALGLGALLVSGYRESRHLAALDGRIAQLDPEVRAVEGVLKELERKRRLLATIDAVDRVSVRPLPVLRDMTDLLPNDAWLTTVSLDPKGVELTGQAAAAAALIPLLENSPRFERVEFASPVTRGREREQFRIRAAWEGGPGAVISAAAAAAPPAGPPAPPAAARRPQRRTALPEGEPR
jgi:general secretion pathway protein L